MHGMRLGAVALEKGAGSAVAYSSLRHQDIPEALAESVPSIATAIATYLLIDLSAGSSTRLL
jgi:hypothetical protein